MFRNGFELDPEGWKDWEAWKDREFDGRDEGIMGEIPVIVSLSSTTDQSDQRWRFERQNRALSTEHWVLSAQEAPTVRSDAAQFVQLPREIALETMNFEDTY